MKPGDHLTNGKCLCVPPARVGGFHPDKKGQVSLYGPTPLHPTLISELKAVALRRNQEATTWQKLKTLRMHLVWRLYRFFPRKSR